MNIERGDGTYFAPDEPVSGGVSSGQPSDDIEEERTEPISEIIKQSQDLYDWLELDVDLQKEMENGNIILPKAEQSETAKENGYDLGIVIPGNLSRADIIQAIDKKVREEYASHKDINKIKTWRSGFIWNSYSTEFEEVSSRTEAQVNKVRPQYPYLCYIKSQIEGHEAHPETAMKTGNESMEVLNKLRETDPILNLHGLTLEEYILSGAQVYRLTGKILDSDYGSESFLLEEKFLDPKYEGSEELQPYYLQGNNFRVIGYMRADESGPRRVSRFLVLPKEIS